MRKVLLIAVAVIAGLYLTVVAIPYGVHRISTAPMVAVADRITAESNWSLESEVITGGPLCSPVTLECDSMHRTYKTSDHLTDDKLREVIDKSGLDLVVDGPCNPKDDSSLSRTCGASGTFENYRVGITVASTFGGDLEIITVQVAKIKG